MKTVIQQLINSFEIDRMQSTYTKEQMIELLNFKLEDEKKQIKDAYTSEEIFRLTADEYYDKKFNKL
jgi:hypothetical protein